MDSKNKMIFGIASIAIFSVGVCLTLAYTASRIKNAIALRQTFKRSIVETIKDIFIKDIHNKEILKNGSLKGSFRLYNGVEFQGSYLEMITDDIQYRIIEGKNSLFPGINCKVDFFEDDTF